MPFRPIEFLAELDAASILPYGAADQGYRCNSTAPLPVTVLPWLLNTAAPRTFESAGRGPGLRPDRKNKLSGIDSVVGQQSQEYLPPLRILGEGGRSVKYRTSTSVNSTFGPILVV